jgi:hypothetical protein
LYYQRFGFIVAFIKIMEFMVGFVWFMALKPLSTIFQLNIMMVSFFGGGNRSTRRKPQTCCKSLTNFIT